MTTIFTTNPIKINVVSIKNNSILMKYVMVGIVPKPVEKELKELEKKPKNRNKVNEIKKFYGPNWAEKLGLGYADLNKKGGEDSDEVPHDSALQDLKNVEEQSLVSQLDPVLDEFNLDDLEFDKKSKDESISMDEIADLFEAPVEDIIAPKTEQVKIEFKSKETKVKFIMDDPFLSIYEEDKISELKRKVFILTGIPIFAQHIWISSHITLALSYTMLLGNTTIPVNINTIGKKYENGELKDKKMKRIDDIPLNIDIHNVGEFVNIEAYDNFKTVGEYYEKYDITEFNIASLYEFIDPTAPKYVNPAKSKQSLSLLYYGFVMIYWPMLTYSVFSEFIKEERLVKAYYPELIPDMSSLKSMYKMEKNIMDNMKEVVNDPKKREAIEKNLLSNIISASMNVVYVSNLKEKTLIPRSLFDHFELNEHVNACKCFSEYEGKMFVLDKTYKNSRPIRETIASEGIIFRIIPKETFRSFHLIFYKNGNYLIKISMLEDKTYGFDDITQEVKKVINPIITKMNKMGSIVLNSGKQIIQMTKVNSNFVDIGLQLFYKKVLLESQFALLKFIMEEFKMGGIMSNKSAEKNFVEYYFRKGMYKFDPRRIDKTTNIRNHYDHMSDGGVKQKWFTLFEKTRITKIFHRFSDVKIDIYGIRQDEFNTFYNLILFAFHELERRKSKEVKEYEFKKLTKKRAKKTLTNLKEQDPVLYNFKKLYNSDTVYSRICQKTYQPILLNKEGYDRLPENQKKNVVKYWNFTNNTDAYYRCPNPKFPYVKFTTKNHPKDYCIPCCKKIPISSNPSDPKRVIHDICLKEHKYTKERKTVTQNSKYIMTYGKDVEEGRLSKLPENSMEGIFYETFSMENETDPSYISSNGFYLYGVNQHSKHVNNIGFIYILAHCLDMSLQKLVTMLQDHVRKDPKVFNMLLNGRMSEYADDNEHFVRIMGIFLGEMSDETKMPWNQIFMELSANYLNINTILFKHKHNSNRIELVLPKGLKDIQDYILKNNRNIIVLKKGKKYFPVYLINTNLFFKLGIVEKKTFTRHDPIIKIIGEIITKQMNKKEVKGKTHKKIDMTVVKQFLADDKFSKKYKMKTLFVDNSNFCYMVCIKNTFNKKLTYMPIEQSYYSFDSFEDVELEFVPYSRKKHRQSFSDLNAFMNEYNRWVEMQTIKAEIKQETDLFSKLKVDNWLLLNSKITLDKTGKVIGFLHNELYYFFDDMSIESARKQRKVDMIPMFYDPDLVNAAIHADPNPKSNPSEELAKNIYKYNLYQLMLLEFLEVFDRTKNTPLRTKIKKLFVGNFMKKLNDINAKLVDMVEDSEDLIKIRMQITDYINNHHDRKLLYADIDNTSYAFDKLLLHKLMKMEKVPLINELRKIASKFITHSIPKNIKYSNLIAACQSAPEQSHCQKTKLPIAKDKFNIYLEILADDILNPMKQKWIFTGILSNRVLRFLRFIERPDEKIRISIQLDQ